MKKLNYDIARKVLVDEARTCIDKFKSLLESGSREWDLMRDLYHRYEKLIQITDLLSEISTGRLSVIDKHGSIIIKEDEVK